MPVLVSSGPLRYRPFAAVEHLRDQHQSEFNESDANCIDLGLINNMSDAALEPTERQILKLLDAASEGLVVRLRLYSLRDVPRTDLGQRHLKRLCYLGDDDLWKADLDGLLITGTEPRDPDLTREPYWSALTKVFDWSEDNTLSTICSCLAVHAAVLHIDGISRHALSNKCFGIFEFEKVSNHPIMAGVASGIRIPHSRWNEVREDELSSSGYTVVTRSERGGVDTFVKQRKSLFMFFQGHPEYEARTLLSEYRRDIERFLRRERDTYPTMPLGYLDEEAVQAFNILQEQASLNRSVELLAGLSTTSIAARLTDPWRSAATSIYRNWLLFLSHQKARKLTSSLVSGF
jgi:homoserine O-succinyltransferase